MNRKGVIPERPQFSSGDARYRIQRTDDGSPTLILRATGDAYHSGCGAATETRHVYLRNGGVIDRLSRTGMSAGRAVSVLELGLGTTMALAMTATVARLLGRPLDYMAIERDWPPADVLERLRLDRVVSESLANHRNADDSPVAPDRDLLDETSDRVVNELLRWRRELQRGVEHSESSRDSRSPQPATESIPAGTYQRTIAGTCDVTVVIDDAEDWCPPRGRFDAVFYDPFAPDSNAALWSTEVLANYFAALRPGGRLVTYCVSRVVRDSLTAVGFTVTRIAGPPAGKREVLCATRGEGTLPKQGGSRLGDDV